MAFGRLLALLHPVGVRNPAVVLRVLHHRRRELGGTPAADRHADVRARDRQDREQHEDERRVVVVEPVYQVAVHARVERAAQVVQDAEDRRVKHLRVCSVCVSGSLEKLKAGQLAEKRNLSGCTRNLLALRCFSIESGNVLIFVMLVWPRRTTSERCKEVNVRCQVIQSKFMNRIVLMYNSKPVYYSTIPVQYFSVLVRCMLVESSIHCSICA